MVIIFTCILNWLSICFREICLVTFIMCALIYRYIHDWIIGVSSMNAPAGTRICVTHDIHNAWQQNHAYPVCKPRFLKSVAHSALSQASQCWPSAAIRESQCADRSQLGGLHARKVYNSGTNTTSDLPRLFLVFLVDAFTCHLLSEWWATSGLSLRVDCVHECRRMIGFFCQKKKKIPKSHRGRLWTLSFSIHMNLEKFVMPPNGSNKQWGGIKHKRTLALWVEWFAWHAAACVKCTQHRLEYEPYFEQIDIASHRHPSSLPASNEQSAACGNSRANPNASIQATFAMRSLDDTHNTLTCAVHCTSVPLPTADVDEQTHTSQQ